MSSIRQFISPSIRISRPTGEPREQAMKAFSMTTSAPLEHPRGSVQSDSRVYSTMKAFNVMTPNVVSVGPDVSINQIARVLVENGISAVPVVDESGAPVGMVSEGDLIPRREVRARGRGGTGGWISLRKAKRSVRISLLISRRPNQKATDVMTCPVVTVHPDINVTEIAQLLATHRIKRGSCRSGRPGCWYRKSCRSAARLGRAPSFPAVGLAKGIPRLSVRQSGRAFSGYQAPESGDN